VTLQGENLLEYGVERPGREIVVARRLAGDLADDPDRGGEREEEAVEIADPPDFEARGLGDLPEGAFRIAALVVVGEIVGAPHPLISGHGDQDPAARGELGGDAFERRLVAIDMFEHVEQGDEVVGAIGDPGEFGKRRVADLLAEPGAGQSARLVVHFERVEPAEAAQHAEIVAGAAADLEDSGIIGQARLARDQIGEDLAAGDVPPMDLVVLGHAVEDGALHQLSLSPSAKPIFLRTT